MAYYTYANAITAIREVLDDGHGNIRTITSSRFGDTLHEGTSEEELARRGVTSIKPFRVRISRRRINDQSPPINSNAILRDHDVEVVVSRTIAPTEQTDSDAMATLEALAWEDADAIEQALCTPPNLATTVAGGATGIVGDCLRYVESRARVVTSKPPARAQRFETIHNFVLIAKVAPAIT